MTKIKAKSVSRIVLEGKCAVHYRVCTGALSAGGSKVGGKESQLPGGQYWKAEYGE